MNFRNKKGSASVFMAMVSVALIGTIMVFVQASKARAVSSAVNSLGNLWTESVTGEYDLNLKNRYAIFGFRSDEEAVSYKVDKMAAYTFSEKKYIRKYNIDSELYDYSLALPAVLKKQIVKAGQMQRLNEEEKKCLNKGVARSIENKVILNSLPSWETDASKKAFSLTEIAESIGSLDEIIKDGGDRYFINNYINCYFKDAIHEKNLGKTFFKNEIEYLICGNTSDEKNEMGMRTRIIAIREILNLKYLTFDSEKNAALTVAAEMLTPGPQAVLTKQALKASWALAESINDYKLLKDGKTVEFLKSDLSWATDLESIINNTESEYVETSFKGGNDYSDYLSFFTWMMSEELLMLRVMDIIQINMCYLYDDSFLMKDTSGGVKIKMTVNEKYYEFTADYQG